MVTGCARGDSRRSSFFNLAAFDAVSYTHLDVYKRQGQGTVSERATQESRVCEMMLQCCFEFLDSRSIDRA